MDAKLPKNSEIDLLANLSGVLYYVVLSFTSLNFMTIDVDGKCEKSPNCYNFIVYILASYICNQGTVKKKYVICDILECYNCNICCYRMFSRWGV